MIALSKETLNWVPAFQLPWVVGSSRFLKPSGRQVQLPVLGKGLSEDFRQHQPLHRD